MYRRIKLNDDLTKFTQDEVAYNLLCLAKERKIINYTISRLHLTSLTLRTKLRRSDFESMLNIAITKTLHSLDVYLARKHNIPEAKKRLKNLEARGIKANSSTKLNFPHIDTVYGYLTRVLFAEGLMELELMTANKRNAYVCSIFKDVGKKQIDITDYIPVTKTRSVDDIAEEMVAYINSRHHIFMSQFSLGIKSRAKRLKIDDIFKSIYIYESNIGDVIKEFNLTATELNKIRNFLEDCVDEFQSLYENEDQLLAG